MNDTRETIYRSREDQGQLPIGVCRFSVGDRLCHPEWKGEAQLRTEPFWDEEFGGWMVSLGIIGVHESNYILSSEKSEWEPHKDGLWSYWTRNTETR